MSVLQRSVNYGRGSMQLHWPSGKSVAWTSRLGYFVKAGLSPYEAIRAGTSAAVRFLNQENEFATIAVGRRARPNSGFGQSFGRCRQCHKADWGDLAGRAFFWTSLCLELIVRRGAKVEHKKEHNNCRVRTLYPDLEGPNTTVSY